ncbi:hypothetical protein ABFX02_13G067800 [Erythranthe guttata]
MDSGITRDSSDDLNWRERCRWNENRKVYTRRINRKPNRTSNNSDTAATEASTAGSPTAVAARETTPNPTTTPTPTNVPSSPAASPSTAKVSTASASEDFNDRHKDSAAASVPPITSGGYPTATPPRRSAADDELHQPLEALVGKDADLSLGQEQSPSNNSVEKNVDTSSTQHQVQQFNDGNEAHNLRESSPRSCENGLSNGREGASAQIPIGIDSDNEGQLISIPTVNGVVKPLVISKDDDKIRFQLVKETSKVEIKELTTKLEFQLDQVRRLVEQVEAKELQLSSCNTQISSSNLSNSNYISIEGGNAGGHSYSQLHDLVDKRVLVRVDSDMGMVGHQEIRPTGLSRVNSDVGSTRNREPRTYSRQLTIAVMENDHGPGVFLEKEKRTPKANQYYRKSEFLLGKDRLPPESNKRLKTSNGRKHNGEKDHAMRFGFGFDKSRNQAFRSCGSLLQKLMKHKHAWVFNEPVDAKAMGLVDYHDIIKHPMDFGTIKTRLSQNWYKIPREFAEDVRLVFRNAMTYNPKGQDVHIMAEELSQVFEEKWAAIEAEYNPYLKYQIPNAPSQTHFAPAIPFPLYVPSAPHMRTFDRPDTMATAMAVDPKGQRTHVGRRRVPKKPKAKDLDKRDMTYEEKQRLSTKLQSLPTEKLDAIVQIIKKRSTALSQHDDEIEVDIDNVDAETLWELDRFVSNFRKSLSKNKRKAELALQARSASNQTVALTNPTSAVVAEVQIENGTALEKSAAPRAAEGDNGRSSSSSSSSSDGSSSSDSDSDSSSENGSDAGQT